MRDGVASGEPSMQDPLAFFITWPTYGTWLPGDQRGWVEYHHGWRLPSSDLEKLCKTKMTESQCLLSVAEREIVVAQVSETCDYRGWQLFAVDCRSNHAHIVIGVSDTNPKKIRIDIKAWCTRRLKEKSNPNRRNWWAERGSIRWIWNRQSLVKVVEYVGLAQGRMEHGR